MATWPYTNSRGITVLVSFCETVSFAADFADDEEARERELTQLLERAELSDNPGLADAVYNIALERGASRMVKRFLGARSEQKKRHEALQAAREQATAVEQEVGWAKSLPFRKPAELNTPVPAEDAG